MDMEQEAEEPLQSPQKTARPKPGTPHPQQARQDSGPEHNADGAKSGPRGCRREKLEFFLTVSEALCRTQKPRAWAVQEHSKGPSAAILVLPSMLAFRMVVTSVLTCHAVYMPCLYLSTKLLYVDVQSVHCIRAPHLRNAIEI